METDTQTLEIQEKMNQGIEPGDCGGKKIRCKTLVIHGGKYKTTFTRKFENRKVWIKANPKEIYSFIPGTITELKVKVGDKVKAGEKMLVFEAMKMLNSMTCPQDGFIKTVNIKVGDKIPKGFLMLEFN